ncbi:prepilin-type N-terminal cleavage/methylation domain-containing protein [Bacillus sp. B15-48]|uniref:PilW family protein n=1 Tax=Bacillus sp. B15-48 TaxID=1548601 RepID=UPI00193F6417|nr:prepilin-type N-terminal cleavage/methylation domain-containing protein [Bacillus sp. B15-48]MBM4761888.1 prepilin-type N-terminal cleavage/methylation domain-containing protein [Bacillus sp. B15-48]
MKRSTITRENGLTLVEVLAGIALLSIVSIATIAYLTSGLDNFRKINEDISLHDEANYVMKRFENEILVATKVEIVSDYPNSIKITKMEGEQVTLGFENRQAVINGNAIHSRYEVSEDSWIKIEDSTYREKYLSIKIIMQEKHTDSGGKKIELKNRIPYLIIGADTIEVK